MPTEKNYEVVVSTHARTQKKTNLWRPISVEYHTSKLGRKEGREEEGSPGMRKKCNRCWTSASTSRKKQKKYTYSNPDISRHIARKLKPIMTGTDRKTTTIT